MNVQNKDIVVVWWWVIGLTVAQTLRQKTGEKVHIIGQQFSTEVPTSSVAWGMWWSPTWSEVSPELARLYTDSLLWFMEIAGDAASGVEMVRGKELFREGSKWRPVWYEYLDLFRFMDSDEVKELHQSAQWWYQWKIPMMHTQRYLDYLLRKNQEVWVSLETTTLDKNNFDKIINQWRIIINAAGFAAREFANDNDIYAVKGQHIVFAQIPWDHTDYIGYDEHPDGMTYILRRWGEVIVGGAQEVWVENRIYDLDEKKLFGRASSIDPSLIQYSDQNPKARLAWVRPARKWWPRIEQDLMRPNLIHAYGHGGSGFSTSIGTAKRVSEILQSLTSR